MQRVGVSFKSSLPNSEIQRLYIQPLREALETPRLGIYSNHVAHLEADPAESVEHLLIFNVFDFEQSLRQLRTTIETLGPPEEVRFHNLDPSEPIY